MNEITEKLDKVLEDIFNIKSEIIQAKLADKDQPDNWPKFGDMVWKFDLVGNTFEQQITDIKQIEYLDELLFGYYRTEQEATKARDYFKAVRIINEVFAKQHSNTHVLRTFMNCWAERMTELVKTELSKHSIDLDSLLEK